MGNPQNDKSQICSFRMCCYYGLSALYKQHGIQLLGGDALEFESLIFDAKRTSGTEFPDFTAHSGFLEHFEVSASSEGRKGSEYRQNIARQKEKMAAKIEAIEKEVEESYNGDFQIRQVGISSEAVNESYENFTKSFYRNWEKHIRSLDRYEYANNGIGVFLIDASKTLLRMKEIIAPGDPQDYLGGRIMHYSFLNEPRYTPYWDIYSLVRDKNLLNYMYDFRQKVKYVVFQSCKCYEVINLNNIPYDFKIYGCPGVNFGAISCITVPNIANESKEEHNNKDL